MTLPNPSESSNAAAQLASRASASGGRASRGPRRGGGRFAWNALAGLVGFALVAVLAATASAADPAPNPPDTLDAVVHTALPGGAMVDAPAYPVADDVHVLARGCDRESSPLASGEYYLAVFNNPGLPLSSDSLAARRFTVDDFGRIVGTSGSHATTRTICPGNGAAFVTISVAPFSTAGVGPGDRLWLRVASRATVDACVKAGDATGFGCPTVERTSVAFRIDPAAMPTASASPSPSASPSDGATPSGSPDASASPSDGASPSPSGDPGASPGASPSDGASPSASVDPAGIPGASPGGSEAPTSSPSIGASPGTSPGASPATSATPAPSRTPAPTASPPPTPVRTPPPIVVPQPGGVSAGGPPVAPTAPSYEPFSIPPGFYVCPGQLITPTGCAPIDSSSGSGSGSGTAGGPTPSWSWGPAPSGAPVFPGINAPGTTTTDPGSVGGVPAGAVTTGAVEAAVDLYGPIHQPGLNGGSLPPSALPSLPASGVPSASGSPGASGPASASASVGTSASAAAGAVAGASGNGQASRPPAPVDPTASETPAPVLPILILLVLLTVGGLAIAARLGWTRRRTTHAGTATAAAVAAAPEEATTLDVPVQSVRTHWARIPSATSAAVTDALRRVRRGLRRGAQIES